MQKYDIIISKNNIGGLKMSKFNSEECWKVITACPGFLRTKANVNKCGKKDEKIVYQCNNEKTQQATKDITKE